MGASLKWWHSILAEVRSHEWPPQFTGHSNGNDFDRLACASNSDGRFCDSNGGSMLTMISHRPYSYNSAVDFDHGMRILLNFLISLGLND